jgi:excisionase family DNA binding protein
LSVQVLSPAKESDPAVKGPFFSEPAFNAPADSFALAESPFEGKWWMVALRGIRFSSVLLTYSWQIAHYLLARQSWCSRIRSKEARLVAVVLKLEEVASYLRVHPSTIYRLVKKRQLPAFKLGSDWRFSRESIDQWSAQAEGRNADHLHSDNQPRPLNRAQ